MLGLWLQQGQAALYSAPNICSGCRTAFLIPAITTNIAASPRNSVKGLPVDKVQWEWYKPTAGR